MSNIKQAAIEFYLDWVNNWLTPASMAAYYDISIDQCNYFIDLGRQWYNLRVESNSVKNSDTTL